MARLPLPADPIDLVSLAADYTLSAYTDYLDSLSLLID